MDIKNDNNNDYPNKRRKIIKSPKDECLDIVSFFKEYSIEFINPVDINKFTYYLDIIKKPMDLNSIDRKLKNNTYLNVYEFAGDMRLIYQNALKYNLNSADPIYRAALKFMRKFEELFVQLIDKIETSSFHKKLCNILSLLYKEKGIAWFVSPVDAEYFRLDDYHQIIKKPMDLGTVYNKVFTYTNFGEFANDLQLITRNAMTYNANGNPVFDIAKNIDRKCRHNMMKHFPEVYILYHLILYFYSGVFICRNSKYGLVVNNYLRSMIHQELQWNQIQYTIKMMIWTLIKKDSIFKIVMM